MTITYFVHSTTIDNEMGRATGWSDSGLSPKGRQQAEELRGFVKNRFDLVWCSDLGRAIETATIAFAPVPLNVDRRLREIDYGKLTQAPSAVVKQDLTKYITEPFPEGESYSDVAVRMLDFLRELKKNYSGKSIALVAHQAPQLALDVILYKKSWTEAFQDDWRNTHSWKPGWEHQICF